MPRTPRLMSTISSLLLLGSLCVLGNSPVEARPAKNTPVASPPKQAPVRTDLTPRDTNDCLAVARTLNEQVKKLARQTRRGIPPEFTRVASDLNQSCGAQEFKKAWISIDWMNGCLDNFTKGCRTWDSVQQTKATLAHSILGQTLVRRDDDPIHAHRVSR